MKLLSVSLQAHPNPLQDNHAYSAVKYVPNYTLASGMIIIQILMRIELELSSGNILWTWMMLLLKM